MRYFLASILAILSVFSVPIQSKELTLGQQYFADNARYFANKLPDNVLVFYAPISQEGDMGDTSDCGKQICIRLDPDYNKSLRVARMTLFHEECHAATLGTELDQHGPRWQACMYRLATVGAFADLW